MEEDKVDIDGKSRRRVEMINIEGTAKGQSENSRDAERESHLWIMVSGI